MSFITIYFRRILFKFFYAELVDLYSDVEYQKGDKFFFFSGLADATFIDDIINGKLNKDAG